MDESVEKFFEHLGGVDYAAAQPASAGREDNHTDMASGHHDQIDRWRMLLVELAYLLNASFQDVHYWEGVKTEKGTFRQLVRTVHELDQMPVHDRTVCVHWRGVRTAKISEKIDYVVTCGDVIVDVPTIAGLTKRMGLRVKHLEGRLLKAFECFADQGIADLILKIPDASDHALEMLRVSLRLLSCFNQAVHTNSTIDFVKDGQRCSLSPILDEMHQPDPNLTMVAALNDLNPATMQSLVQKVATIIRAGNGARTADQPATVFHALFNIDSLRQRLVKPPIEITGTTSIGTPSVQKGGAGSAAGALAEPSGGGRPSPQAGHVAHGIVQTLDPGIVKARVARFVKETFRSSPQHATRIMHGIFGRDYHRITRENLGERLILLTDLVRTLDQNPDGQYLLQEVLRRIQTGLDRIPHELLDDVCIDANGLKMWTAAGEKVVSQIDEQVLDLIDTVKQRAARKRKRRTALNLTAEFGSAAYEIIASDFGISAQDAEDTITIFKSCFDDQGNFMRASFEKNIPLLARHEKKVFDILWGFLKETPRRSDRLPLLNSLQSLIRHIKKPIHAIKVLLAELIEHPAAVEYPDRNAIILANQLVRTYNKEINMDIEITPEEVLLVKEGVDRGVVNYARWKVDGEQKRFFEKIVTIRKKILESLDPTGAIAQPLPIRFLLALEREVHIFLALVGGKTAHAVIRGALNVYGNPASQVFMLTESPHHIPALLQHLSVLIRGIGRVGTLSDLPLLAEVKDRQAGFLRLGDDDRHKAVVRRVIGWIDSSQKEIRRSSNA